MTQTEIEEALREQNIKAKFWQKNGMLRLYFNDVSRRDAKVFIDFPDSDPTDPYGGARLRVQIADCGQHGAWYQSQRQKIAQRYIKAYDLVLRLIGAADEADEVVAEFENVERRCGCEDGAADARLLDLVSG